MSDNLTPRQRRQLKQWTAEAAQWISIEEAQELIKRFCGTTAGHAQRLLLEARASGEVRFANDDGTVRDPQYDYAYSKDDLVGWLNRQAPKGNKPKAKNKLPRFRYAGDAALVKQAQKLI